MGDYKRPKKWKERTSCWDTEYRIFKSIMDEDITELEAKGIMFMLFTEWFGSTKATVINIIMDLKDEKHKE